MLGKSVPGFCTEVLEACEILGVHFDELVEDDIDIRKFMKHKVIEIQSKQLVRNMVGSSKMDKVLLGGFNYNGEMMKYLKELDFGDARAVFMTRYRMLPSKNN